MVIRHASPSNGRAEGWEWSNGVVGNGVVEETPNAQIRKFFVSRIAADTAAATVEPAYSKRGHPRRAGGRRYLVKADFSFNKERLYAYFREK